MARLILLALLWGMAGAALADPVSVIASAIVAFEGYTGWAAFAVFAGAGLINNSLARRRQAKMAAEQRAQYNASLQDRNVTVLSSESPWQVVYGNPAPLGGSIAAILTSGGRDEFSHLLVVFAAHPCQAIDEVYIDGVACGALDSSGWVTGGDFLEGATGTQETITESLTFNTSGVATASNPVSALVTIVNPAVDVTSGGIITGATASGATITLPVAPATPVTYEVTYGYNTSHGRVNIQKHLSPGGVDVSDAFIMARCPDKWGSTDLLSGYTYIWITLDKNFSRFQGGPPNITARLRGKNSIYDPRTGTRGYSNNPALCLADFIMSEPGFGATSAQLDMPALIAAANAADSKSFTADGAFQTNQDRETTKQQLEDSFGGSCHESGGVWRIMAGAWSTPVMSITSADVAAPIEIDQAGYTAKDRYNTVRGTFIDASGLGVGSDFTPWANAAYVAADGLSRIKDVQLHFTGAHQQTQDLARMQVERSRGGLSITLPGQMRLWPVQPGDRVSVTNAEFGWAAKTFRVTDWGFHPKAPVALKLVEDVAVYYDAAAIITQDAAPNTDLPNPYSVPLLADLSADSGTAQLIRQTDGTITSRVRVQWTASTNNYVAVGGQVQVQWREATSTAEGWTDAATVAGSASSVYLTGLPDGTAVLLRARFVNQLNITGPWTTIAHAVLGKSEPPSTPANVFVTSDLLVYFGKVTDFDVAGYLVRAVAGTTATWSRGLPLHDGVVTDSPWRIPGALYGVQTLMVAAIDTSGNVGGCGSYTLDFSQPSTANSVQSLDYRAGGFAGTITGASVSGGDLLADVQSSPDLYALDDLYAEANLYGALYKPMSWVSTSFVPLYGGGTVYLSTAMAGASPAVEYRIDGDTLVDLYSTADLYASADLYGAPGAWQPWPGSYSAQRMQGIQFRASIDGSAVQGGITAFIAYLAAQEAAQSFSQQAILAGGTRLDPAVGAPARKWITVRGVQITPITDGSGAIAGRVMDFSAALGPLTQLIDNTGAAVGGTATIDVKGLADV